MAPSFSTRGLLVEKGISKNFSDIWNTTMVCCATPLVNPKGASMGQAGVFGVAAFEGLHLSEVRSARSADT